MVNPKARLDPERLSLRSVEGQAGKDPASSESCAKESWHWHTAHCF